MDILLNFKSFLLKCIPEIVVKYQSEASKFETLEIVRASDKYVAAKLKTDSWNSYISFSKEILLKSGFTLKESEDYAKDKNLIPIGKREFVLNIMRDYIINNYEEYNNYYRQLYGLPNIEDMEEVWLDPIIYEKYSITPSPVHTLDHEILVSMEQVGDLDSIRKKYPNKKYLFHLGMKRIDIVSARIATNYQILYFPRYNDSTSFYRDFMNYYEECREYFLTVIYNRFYAGKYDYYDSYIAFTILTMTVNNMIAGVLKTFVARDFYDIDMCKTFLSSYGIPYDNKLTFLQLKLLAKNLNILLSKKSTNQVLLDLVDLLGYKDFDLMQYYLVKQHKMQDGKPVFFYKEEKDEDGNIVTVLDENAMYDYYFVRSKIDIEVSDMQSILKDELSKISYSEMTNLDQYWVDDVELREKLAHTNFNYIETKYMDVDVTYRLYEIMFEIIYLSRLILDKKETKNLTISLPKVSDADITLFDMINILICLMCKIIGVEPDIIKTPSKILGVMGFNFKADFNAIKKEILKYEKYGVDKSLIQYIHDATFNSAYDVNRMYVNVRDLNDLLVIAMANTDEKELYQIYHKLYQSLMVTEVLGEQYAINGEIPEQYTDYLKIHNFDVYERIENMTEDECSNMVDYITTKMLNMFTDSKYIANLQILDIHAVDSLLKLLRFFKSYTVEMKDSNIVLLLDSRYYNLTKTMHSIDMTSTIYIPDVYFIDNLLDYISINGKIKTSDKSYNLDTPKLFIAKELLAMFMRSLDTKLFMTSEVQITSTVHMLYILCMKGIISHDIYFSIKEVILEKCELYHQYRLVLKELFVSYEQFITIYPIIYVYLKPKFICKFPSIKMMLTADIQYRINEMTKHNDLINPNLVISYYEENMYLQSDLMTTDIMSYQFEELLRFFEKEKQIDVIKIVERLKLTEKNNSKDYILKEEGLCIIYCILRIAHKLYMKGNLFVDNDIAYYKDKTFLNLLVCFKDYVLTNTEKGKIYTWTLMKDFYTISYDNVKIRETLKKEEHLKAREEVTFIWE